MAKQLYYADPVKRYIVKNRDGVVVANGVSHTAEEVKQMKAAGYKVKEVTNG